MAERPRGRPRSRSRSGDRRPDNNNRNRRDDRDRNRDSDRGRDDRRQSYAGPSGRDDFNNRGQDYDRRSFGGDRGGFRGGHRGGHRGGYNSGGSQQNDNRRPPQSEPRLQNEVIEVHTNYFTLLNKPNWKLYQYHAFFEPMIESKGLRIALLYKHEELLGKSKAFDGSTLFTLTQLPNPEMELESVKNFDQNIVKIKLRLVAEVTPNSKEAMRLMNLVFKKCLKSSKYTEFGRERAYFDFDNMYEMRKYGLKIAAGYKASIDIYQDSLLLCTEIAHKLINLDTILDVMKNLHSNSNGQDYKQMCYEKLVGCTLMASYSKKTHRIDDIAWDISPRDTFSKKDGTQITYADYYFEHYKIKIRDMNQPMLLCLPKEKDKRRMNQERQSSNDEKSRKQTAIYLVPELCVLTGTVLLKEYAKDFSMKKDMDAITKLNPDVRVNRLNDFIDKINKNERAREEMATWQMKIDPQVVRCPALALKSEKIVFAHDNSSNCTQSGWNNLMKNGKHIYSVPLEKWYLIYQARDENRANFFLSEIQNVSNPMGLRINSGILWKLPDSRSNPIVFASSIKDILRKEKPQILVFILPNSAKDTYDAIKTACCVEYGIPSQCITSNILNDGNGKAGKARSAITKIAIQMNCKLGGVVWGVEIPITNIMVVGIDLYKDSAKRNQSVVAFVASTNGTETNKLNCTKYFSKCIMQPKNQDYIDHLQALMVDALIKYYENNQTYPDRIIVYRDGVSDGQFDVVKAHEIPQLTRAFLAINSNYKPFLTFMVVKKRGNSRFFYQNDGNFINPPMGTVINSKVVKQQEEFYLVSQSSDRGTVSPTHFHILERSNDDQKLNLERLPILTFKLTHLYYNWPGQIRTPSICQYATKLAHLVGESLHREHSQNLDDKLFYL